MWLLVAYEIILVVKARCRLYCVASQKIHLHIGKEVLSVNFKLLLVDRQAEEVPCQKASCDGVRHPYALGTQVRCELLVRIVQFCLFDQSGD